MHNIVLIEVKFLSDLKIGEIQSHQVQAQYPSPQGLMMSCQDRIAQVIEAFWQALHW
jgi:hypothetical protein